MKLAAFPLLYGLPRRLVGATQMSLAPDFTYSLVVVSAAVPAISPVAAISPAVATTITAAVVAIPFPVLHLVPDQIPATGPNQTADDSASTRRTNRRSNKS